jgi:hypothetical protein
MGYLETRRVMKTVDKIVSGTEPVETSRAALAEKTLDLGKASTSSTASTKYQGSIFFLIASFLGLIAVLVLVFALVLALSGHTPDAALYTLGSAAVGGLAGVFNSPSGSSSGGATSDADTSGGTAGPGSASDSQTKP